MPKGNYLAIIKQFKVFIIITKLYNLLTLKSKFTTLNKVNKYKTVTKKSKTKV